MRNRAPWLWSVEMTEHRLKPRGICAKFVGELFRALLHLWPSFTRCGFPQEVGPSLTGSGSMTIRCSACEQLWRVRSIPMVVVVRSIFVNRDRPLLSDCSALGCDCH